MGVSALRQARAPPSKQNKKHRIRVVDCNIAFSRLFAYRPLIEQRDRFLFEDPRVLPYEIGTDAAHD